MRTTISLPDEVYDAAMELAGARPFSDFASEAIQARVFEARRERFTREMDEGYRAEAITPSLDGEWAQIEVDGL